MLTICKAAIDWSATGAMLSGWGTLLGVGAVLWAANKAANTFHAWKKQKVAERKFELAEKILTATYHANEALNFVRHAATFGHELDEARKTVEAFEGWAGMPKARQERLVLAQSKFIRLRNTKDRQDALIDCLPMAEALFDLELEQAITTLHHQFWCFQVDLEAYVDDEGLDAEFTKQIRGAIWKVAKNVDEAINKATNESIATIKKHCLPMMRDQ